MVRIHFFVRSYQSVRSQFLFSSFAVNFCIVYSQFVRSHFFSSFAVISQFVRSRRFAVRLYNLVQLIVRFQSWIGVHWFWIYFVIFSGSACVDYVLVGISSGLVWPHTVRIEAILVITHLGWYVDCHVWRLTFSDFVFDLETVVTLGLTRRL